MSNLPQTAQPLNGGSAENPYIRPEFSWQLAATAHLPARPILGWVHVPEELEKEPYPVRRLFDHLHKLSRYFGNLGGFQADETLARDTGLPLRTLQDALKRLEKLGWIVREQGNWPSGTGRMAWCLWRKSSTTGRDYDLGHGLKIAAEDLTPVVPAIRRAIKATSSLPTPTAGFGAPDRKNLTAVPQEPAHKVNQGFNSISANVNGLDFAADAGGEETPPVPELIEVAELVAAEPIADQVETPLPPAITAEEIRIATELLAGPFRKSPEAMAVSVWTLIDSGNDDLVPKWFAGPKRPDRPKPEVLAVVRGVHSAQAGPVKPAAVVESLPVEKLRELLPETLISRLGDRIDAEQREAIVGIVAGKMAWDWDDYGGIGGFKSRLRMVGPDKADLKCATFLKAYRAASNSSADRKGAIFQTVIRPHLPRRADDQARA